MLLRYTPVQRAGIIVVVHGLEVLLHGAEHVRVHSGCAHL
jgi:hypothetical protein